MIKRMLVLCSLLVLVVGLSNASAINLDGNLSDWGPTGSSYFHSDPAGDNTRSLGGADLIKWGAKLQRDNGKLWLYTAYEFNPVGTFSGLGALLGDNSGKEVYMESVIDVDQKTSTHMIDSANGINWVGPEWTAGGFTGMDISTQWGGCYVGSGSSWQFDRGLGMFGYGTDPGWGPQIPHWFGDVGYHFYNQAANKAIGSNVGDNIDAGDGQGYMAYNPNGWTFEWRMPVEEIIREIYVAKDGDPAYANPTSRWTIGAKPNIYTGTQEQWTPDYSGVSEGSTLTADTIELNLGGDANLDGLVNVSDLGILAANYGTSGKLWGQGDFNGDGLVNVSDLGILAATYGQITGGAVPEPMTMVLLGLGGIGLLRKRV